MPTADDIIVTVDDGGSLRRLTGSLDRFSAALHSLGDAGPSIEVHDIAPIPALKSIAGDLAERKQRHKVEKSAEKIALGHLHGLNRHQKRCLERQQRQSKAAKPL